MNSIRWSVLVPIALFAAIAQPALRALAFGGGFPDLLFLLLLLAVPHSQEVQGRTLLLVFLLGSLRCVGTVVSPFATWAGFGCGLLARGFAASLLRQDRFVSRLLTGAFSVFPVLFFDKIAASHFGLVWESPHAFWQIAGTGLLWSLAMAPPPLPGRGRVA